MALKQKIDKAAYDALPEAIKFEYKADAAGAYVLDVEGYEDPGELRRAKDREAQARKEEKARADKAEADLKALQEANGDTDEARARKAGDIVTLEKSWQGKLTAAEQAAKDALAKERARTTRFLVDGVAQEIAGRISVSPSLLLPHIKARLAADFDGDEPTTRVLGADGKLSALTIADLEKEFVANTDFAAIIKGSDASGGGANGGQQKNGGAAKKLSEMNDAERVAFQKANPAEFKKQVAAQPPAVRL